MELTGVTEQPDLAVAVARTTEIVVHQTIDIPPILVVPKGEAKSGFRPFTLALFSIKHPAPDHGAMDQLFDVIEPGYGSIEE